MRYVTFIFVNTQKSLFNRCMGRLINAFQHSRVDFAPHVAIQFDYLKGYGPKILEDLPEGVVLSEYSKYRNDEKQCKITISLSEEEYDVLEQKAIEIAEHKYCYSFKAGIIGGIANSINRNFAKWLAGIMGSDTDDELNCSETATILIRMVRPQFIPNLANSEITPYDIYIELIVGFVNGDFNIIKITKY